MCEQRKCPAVSCPHPTLNSCACEVCDGCNFYGRDCLSGEQFAHPTDSCQRCSCQVLPCIIFISINCDIQYTQKNQKSETLEVTGLY